MKETRTLKPKELLKKLAGVLWNSHALAVAAVVLAVNFVFMCASPFGKTTAENLPVDHSWVYWATKDYVNQPEAPDVVFLGSSLFLHPFAMLDAKHTKKAVDHTNHHRTEYAQDRIAKEMGLEKPVCATFAMPGSLISDDWIIFETLMKGKQKPKVVVLGISARDFIDNKVRCPGTTPTFKYLSRLIDVEPLLDLAMPEWRDRTDFIAGRVAYLWGSKPSVQAALADQAKSVMAPYMGTIYNGRPFSKEEKEKLVTLNIDAQLEPGWSVITPDYEPPFEDNTKDFGERYKTRHESLLNIEKEFFKRLIKSTKEANVQLVVLNMPMASLNTKMMPPGFYDEYRDFVKTTTKENGVLYRDFYGDQNYSSSVFYDIVHMNYEGGRRLINEVVEMLSKDRACSIALRERKNTGIASSGGHL